jgi:group I intron endonuclease
MRKSINISEGQGSLPFRSAYLTPNYFTIKFDLDKELKMNQENGTIYIVTNLLNGKQNIGQTTRKLTERIWEHKTGVGSVLLHKAVKKYGMENFKWVSFSCPEEDLDWQETFLIKELNTLVPNGYNLETGGHKNKHHHEITKQKMSKNHSNFNGKNNPFYGKKHTEEAIKKMKNSCPDRKGENNPNYGNHKLVGENNPMYGKRFYDIWVEKYGKEIADKKHTEWVQKRVKK